MDKLIFSGFDTEGQLIYSVVTEDGTELDDDMVNRIMEFPAEMIGEAENNADEEGNQRKKTNIQKQHGQVIV